MLYKIYQYIENNIDELYENHINFRKTIPTQELKQIKNKHRHSAARPGNIDWEHK